MLRKFFAALLSLGLLVGSAGAASASTHKATHRAHIKPSAESWSHIKPASDSWTSLRR